MAATAAIRASLEVDGRKNSALSVRLSSGLWPDLSVIIVPKRNVSQ